MTGKIQEYIFAPCMSQWKVVSLDMLKIIVYRRLTMVVSGYFK